VRHLPLLALPLALVACQQSAAPEPAEAVVEATDPWCRPTPNGMTMTACYITLTSSTGDRLTDIISPRAAQAQIHAVSTEGGVMSMTPMENGLELPAGQAVALAPGGDHIMLTGLTVPLAEGDLVPLALTFGSGAQIAMEAPVRIDAPGGESVHASH